MLREMGFTLESEIDRLEDRLEEIEDEQDQLAREAERWQEEEDDEKDAEYFKTLKRDYNELEEERQQAEAQTGRFQRYVDEWESTEFRVRELSFGEVQQVKDIVSEESFDVDVELQEVEGTPLQGVYQSEVLNRAVEEMPEPAPDDPNDLPEILGDWLMEKVESVNEIGDENLSTTSLEERIN